ncbi:MAG TPA: hypothetical protein VLD37_07640 [Candidatus Bilamarchaeum sp.]|nr:hypothetical protein [Candidatus Bilamarchaeum sp.]
MTENSPALKAIAQPESPAPRKSRLFGGLVEGVRSYRSRREISALLKEASAGSVAEALEIFSTLDEKGRHKAMSSAQDSLRMRSAFPFEDPSRAAAIGALGEFIAGAARCIPSGQGKAYPEAAEILRKIAQESSFYRSDNPAHCAAKLACAKALWALGGADRDFWAEMAAQDASAGYVIPKLLETAEGRAILKGSLKETAAGIASCQSGMKTEFLVEMLAGADRDTAKSIVSASLALETIPREIVAKARELFNSADPEIEALKLPFSKAVWKSRTGNRVFWTERLFDQPTSDFTLSTLLNDKTDGWSLLKEHLEAVAIPIATGRSERKAEFLEAMLSDSNPQVIKVALASSIYLDPVPEEFSARAVEISRLGSELNTYARIFFDALEFKGLLVYADDRQFQGAMGLIGMYRGGVNFLPPMLFMVGTEMAELYVNPAGASEAEKEANRSKAGGVLAHLAMAGIQIPGVEIKFHEGEK